MGEEPADTLPPADWLKTDVRSGPGRSLRAPLLKAVGIKRGEPFRPVVLDATAGYGADAWLLAAAGCTVIAVERHPAVFAALSESRRRALEAQADVAERIALRQADALKLLSDPEAHGLPGIDCVLIDPMYPGGRKTLEKKSMRLLRTWVGDDPDADALLAPALRITRRRVAVKRPRKAAPLDHREADLTYEGRGFRFDVYLARRSKAADQGAT